MSKITALYCRLSREDEKVETSTSIETQKEFLRRYCKDNKLFNIKYYLDDGYSGTTFDRPGFKELLNDIEDSKISIVITKDLSRLGRDYLQTGYYIEHYFPLNEIRYIAVNDGVDTNKSDNELAPFRNIMNEWYARDISKKVRSAYRTKALNGEFTGAYPPYGYDKDPKNKNHLIINEQQAIIVRRIFNYYLNNISPYKIAKILKNEKVLTPRAELFKLTNRYKNEYVIKYPYEWSSQTIISILKNEEYTGKIISNKNQTRNYKTKKLKRNQESEWIYVNDKHDSIIDIESFDKVKVIMNSRISRRIVFHNHIFKGKLRCDKCGCVLTYTLDKRRKDKPTYACSTYRRYGKERCSSHYISYQNLYDKVLENLNAVSTYCRTNGNKLSPQDTESDNPSLGDKKAIIDRQQEISIIYRKLYEDYALDRIEVETYNEMTNSYEKEIKELKRQLINVNNEEITKEKRKRDLEEFINRVTNYGNIEKLTEEILHDLVDKIIIKEDRNIVLYFKNIGIINM